MYQLHRSIHFRCDLDLQWYPFDSQRCHLYFTIKDLTDSSGRLVKVGARYSLPHRPPALPSALQYTLKLWHILKSRSSLLDPPTIH